MIDRHHPSLSLRRQCDLLGLNRATFYREPAGETPLNLDLMRLIDAEYTQRPFYGYRKMMIRLQAQGYAINHKRVARLMRLDGFARRLSTPADVDPRRATQEISVFAARSGDHATQSGLVGGYYQNHVSLHFLLLIRSMRETYLTSVMDKTIVQASFLV